MVCIFLEHSMCFLLLKAYMNSELEANWTVIEIFV